VIRRFDIAYVLILAFAMAGCQTIQFSRPGVVDERDWLVDGYSQNRSRSVDATLELPLVQAWEYNAAGAFGQGAPLVFSNQVLVGTRKGEIHAIELETGRKAGYKNIGDGIEATPLIQNGVMFVASAIGKNTLLAYDLKTGGYRWRVRGDPIESGLLAGEGLLVAADIYGVVKAYRQESGEEAWSVTLGDRVSVQTTILMIDGTGVFVADDSGMAHLLRLQDGAQLWKTKLSGPVYESPAAYGSLIVVPTTRGALDALNAEDGSLAWTHSGSRGDMRFGSVAISGDLIVAGATDGMVRGLHPRDGHALWSVQIPDVVIAAPLISNGLVFVGSMGRKLYALDRESGAVRWETTLRGRIKSAMAIVDDGLLVLSEPRYVTYFKHGDVQNGGQDEASE
jgi:outer membrane protein assembly factor BamB